MDKKYIVYKHTNLINNKSYVGITKESDPNKRWKDGKGYSYNKKFFQDIIDFGWNNFSHEILEQFLTEDEALEKEKFYIKKFDCVNHGYNQIYGNLGFYTRTPESIEKQMDTKHSRYGSGRSVNYHGKKRKVKCLETGDIFESISDASRWCGSKKVILCCQGKREHAGYHPELGIQLSWAYVDNDEPITIICENPISNKFKDNNTSKIIVCVETGEEFYSAKDAERKTGISGSNINRVCNGLRKTAGKKHWKYKEIKING